MTFKFGDKLREKKPSNHVDQRLKGLNKLFLHRRLVLFLSLAKHITLVEDTKSDKNREKS